MKAFRSLTLLFLAWLSALAALPAHAAAAVVTTPQVRAELVAHAPDGVVPGKPLWLGLKIEHQPHWHTYWKNPGDSGLPTTMAWQLPAGVQAGEIEWPTPSKLPLGPLMNYGYDGTLLLPVPVTVPADFKGESLDVQLHAEWLVCKDVCIPESGDFTLRLPAQAATATHAALFATARAALPQPAAGSQGSATLDGQTLVVKVSGLPAAWHGRKLSFFPETTGVINNAAQPETAWADGSWSARVPLDPQRSASPASMPAVLVAQGEPAGLQVQVTVNGPWPALAPLPAAFPCGRARGGPGVAPAAGHHAGPGAAAGAGGWGAPEPDALRLPGAVAEGDGLRQARRRPPRPARRWPGLHRRRRVVLPGVGRPVAGAARRR